MNKFTDGLKLLLYLFNCEEISISVVNCIISLINPKMHSLIILIVF